MDWYCKSDTEMEDSADEAFEKFIVVCDDDADDKENFPQVSENAKTTNTKMKRQKTKKEQFVKIIEFTKGKFLLQSDQ